MLKDRLKKQVRDWCDKAYPKKLEVEFKPEHRPLQNHRCHNNADHMVRCGDAVSIAEVVMIDDDTCTLHYINMDDQGVYFDATLGYQYSGSDYRLIRLIHTFKGYPGSHLEDEKARICLEALGKWRNKLNDPLNML